jgi:hypothetical protein
VAALGLRRRTSGTFAEPGAAGDQPSQPAKPRTKRASNDSAAVQPPHRRRTKHADVSDDEVDDMPLFLRKAAAGIQQASAAVSSGSGRMGKAQRAVPAAAAAAGTKRRASEALSAAGQAQASKPPCRRRTAAAKAQEQALPGCARLWTVQQYQAHKQQVRQQQQEEAEAAAAAAAQSGGPPGGATAVTAAAAAAADTCEPTPPLGNHTMHGLPPPSSSTTFPSVVSAAAAGGGSARQSSGRSSAAARDDPTNPVKPAVTARAAKVKFGRSGVHAWGVFADETIEKESFIIEYIGELIRPCLADKREAEYAAAGCADYLFRIEKEWVCDATRTGGLARYLNHSCSPNCYTKIYKEEGRSKIGIFSLQRVERGAELVYDYKVGGGGVRVLRVLGLCVLPGCSVCLRCCALCLMHGCKEGWPWPWAAALAEVGSPVVLLLGSLYCC